MKDIEDFIKTKGVKTDEYNTMNHDEINKNLVLVLGHFLLGAHISFAQSQATNLTDEQKEELAQNFEEYYEVLNLSKEQKSEFEAITKKYAKQMKAVKDGGGGKLQISDEGGHFARNLQVCTYYRKKHVATYSKFQYSSL